MDNINKIIGNEYCKLILGGKSLNDEETSVLKEKIKIMAHNNIHVPYELITNEIFNCDDSDSKVNTAELILDTVSNIGTAEDKIISDTKRHLELSKIQNNFIIKKTQKAEEELKKIRKDSKKISKIKDSIYTDLIAVLGVFTAISFAAFGGITSVSAMFANSNKMSIHLLLICASISYLIIYGVSVTLFVGISKLMQKDKPYKFTWITIGLLGIPIVILLLSIFVIKN